jgi:hypothetical protein
MRYASSVLTTRCALERLLVAEVARAISTRCSRRRRTTACSLKSIYRRRHPDRSLAGTRVSSAKKTISKPRPLIPATRAWTFMVSDAPIHAPIDHRSPGAPGPQRAGQRGQALLFRSCTDGKLPGLGGRYPADSGQRQRRTAAALAMAAQIAGPASESRWAAIKDTTAVLGKDGYVHTGSSMSSPTNQRNRELQSSCTIKSRALRTLDAANPWMHAEAAFPSAEKAFAGFREADFQLA